MPNLRSELEAELDAHKARCLEIVDRYADTPPAQPFWNPAEPDPPLQTFAYANPDEIIRLQEASSRVMLMPGGDAPHLRSVHGRLAAGAPPHSHQYIDLTITDDQEHGAALKDPSLTRSRFDFCTFTGLDYAIYAIDGSGFTDVGFYDCAFQETSTKEALVRTRGCVRALFRNCTAIKSGPTTKPDGTPMWKRPYRFYDCNGVWIDGGASKGSAISFGEDNSPGSGNGVCRDIWITNHTMHHTGLNDHDLWFCVVLGQNVEDLNIDGGTYVSPRTNFAISAFIGTRVNITGSPSFNGEPMTEQHVRWKEPV